VFSGTNLGLLFLLLAANQHFGALALTFIAGSWGSTEWQKK
jgi:hypothetical protein